MLLGDQERLDHLVGDGHAAVQQVLEDEEDLILGCLLHNDEVELAALV